MEFRHCGLRSLSVPTVSFKFSFSILTTQKLRRRIPVLSLNFLFPLFLLCSYQPANHAR